MLTAMLEFKLMRRVIYVIRPMEQDDIPQVARIDQEAFPDEWMFRLQSSYKRDLDSPSMRYVVACVNNGDVSKPSGERMRKLPWFRQVLNYGNCLDSSEYIVGFAGFWMILHEAHIIAIATTNDYRRIGIGEGLLISAIELAALLNANVVTLEVRASNKIAQALYNKYGFQVVGRRVKYYSSDGEDALIMSTDNIGSDSFQACFQQLKKSYAKIHREILTKVV